MRTFTTDERYALDENFLCGRATADHHRSLAESHRRAARYNCGSLTPCELATAYALGCSTGCSEPGPRWGDSRDAKLPSPAVHAALGYLVASTWRARADLIAHQHGCEEYVSAWMVELAAADAAVTPIGADR